MRYILTESQLLKLISEQDQQNQPTTIKDLKKNGYNVKMGDFPLDSYKDKTLVLTNISAVGQTDSGTQLSFNQALSTNNINKIKVSQGSPNFREGFIVTKKLDNGNVEYRLVKISQ